jgi:hypothetical protein
MGFLAGEELDEQRLPSEPLFPPTPTSTRPGTPHGELEFLCNSAAMRETFLATCPLVDISVPIHLAPQVMKFVEHLRLQEGQSFASRHNVTEDGHQISETSYEDGHLIFESGSDTS